jgi:putative hydrolase of the HAD superfamily
MASVDAIFFDLDETLLDDERGWHIALAATCREVAGRHPGVDETAMHEAYTRSSERLWTTFGSAPRTSAGLTSTRDLRREIWLQVLGAFGASALDLAEEILDEYEGHRRANYAVFQEVPPLLQQLAGSYQLAVITNGPSEGQREKLTVTGIALYFDVILTSNDLGVGKPDPAIFRHAVDTLSVEPSRTWHVGDSLEADIAGAQAAGLGAAVWMNRRGAERPAHAPMPHHEISTLLQLLPLLDLVEG